MFHFDGNRVYVLRFAAAGVKGGEKKQRSLALDTRFGRNNAAAKRLRDEKLRSSQNAGESHVCVVFWHIIQKFNCLTAISLNTDIRMFPNTFSEISY